MLYCKRLQRRFFYVFGENTILLNDQREMPLLGLGVYKATDHAELCQAIKDAVSCGYRLIDTASFYKNEEGVGKGIKALDLPREELFITTKYGIPHSVSEILRTASTEAWNVWDWIMLICI